MPLGTSPCDRESAGQSRQNPCLVAGPGRKIQGPCAGQGGTLASDHQTPVRIRQSSLPLPEKNKMHLSTLFALSDLLMARGKLAEVKV